MGRVVVFGASPDPLRYANIAVRILQRKNFEVLALGNRPGRIGKIDITLGYPMAGEVDWLLMYISAERQKPFYSYLLGMNPRTIIFNPGAENPELAVLAAEKQISVLNECALVMIEAGRLSPL